MSYEYKPSSIICVVSIISNWASLQVINMFLFMLSFFFMESFQV